VSRRRCSSSLLTLTLSLYTIHIARSLVVVYTFPTTNFCTPILPASPRHPFSFTLFLIAIIESVGDSFGSFG
jgi:hypothetical protein